MKLERPDSEFVPARGRGPLSAAAGACALALALGCGGAGAAPLTLAITNPDRIGVPGTPETFSGTITNDTGVDLNASDLFLDFAGYDAAHVTLTQLLGVPDFVIPGGSTSSFTDLFVFDLGITAAVPATFFADVVVEDVNNDFSDPVTVSVTTVPEPGSLGLGGLALLAAGLTWMRSVAARRSGRRHDAAPSSRSELALAAARGGSSC